MTGPGTAAGNGEEFIFAEIARAEPPILPLRLSPSVDDAQ
jgi:hypothetical protein